MSETPQDQAFAERARRALQASEALDEATRARLAAARGAALAASARPRAWQPVAGGLALAATVLLAVFVLYPQGRNGAPPGLGHELDLMAAQDDLEFYRDLDFYQWLAAGGADAG